ncbi:MULTISPECIES: hypothetical protein [Legionella]|uniref:Transmembrane protein n=1 Tax=Legionella resiliens TaxID=2905958 RepID=A0ABS8X9H6_9GAMM|nr:MULTISPECIES: hypothetical protein [unclassified Legionella]MCE0724456.1 hypothetical protein [Legionella sp. 9fVS26]MCE3533608.1 hypothetical protein [Legionella sp. 8cVS16]QLZ69798.1 hypothetical protein FOLKNPGA_02597 [Legionella sp. PC1000]
MVNKNTPNHEHCHIHPNKRISWTAVFVGALTALGLSFLLNLLGIAIGLSAFKTMSNGSVIVVVGGLLGIIIGVAISTIAAGYVAGYLGRLYCPARNLGIIYGFTTWVLALILGAALIGLLSQYVVTYTNSVSRTVVAVPITVNQISTPVGTTKISSLTKNGQKEAVVEVNVTPTNLASGALIIFVLFLLGAIFTCVGAGWGMRCKKDDDSL